MSPTGSSDVSPVGSRSWIGASTEVTAFCARVPVTMPSAPSPSSPSTTRRPTGRAVVRRPGSAGAALPAGGPGQDGEPTNGAWLQRNRLPQRGTVAGMGRIVTLVIGAVLVLLGLVWILQGLDILGGSGMSGHAIWAVIGVVIGGAGVFLVIRGLRMPSARDHV